MLVVAVGSVIRTDGLTMNEWAQQQIQQGKAIGVATAPVVGQSQIMKEWAERRRRAVE